MTKDEALRLALDTLKEVREETFRLLRNGEKLYAEDKVWSTIITIQEALETKDKPVSCAECGADGGHALYCVACAEKYVNKGTRMTKEIYLKQYQEARGTVTMPNEPMWVDKWEVCVKFDSLEEARSFRNEIENPRPNFSITMRVKDNVPHTGIEKLNLTVRTERCLKAEDIISIEQLQCCTEERLLKTPNLGRKAINEIKEKMAEFGYKLRGQE